MEQKDIDKLIQSRAFVDDYRAKMQKEGMHDVAGLIDNLKTIGFTSANPIQEFFDWSSDMNLKCLVYSYRIEGECDNCKGLPQKRCVALGFWGVGTPTICGQFVAKDRQKFAEITGVDFVSPTKGVYPVTYGYLI